MDNFPINEDLVHNKMRDLMFDMMGEDPEQFQVLSSRLNELMDLPKRTMTLFWDLMAATPFEVNIPKHVLRNDPETFEANETVSNVRYLGDFGGIAVELEANEDFDKSRVISITMVEMPIRHPLRKRVNEYQKKRTKYLRKQPIR